MGHITDEEFQKWLQEDNSTRVLLVEVEFYSTSLETMYLSNLGYITHSDDTDPTDVNGLSMPPVHTIYEDIVEEVPDISVSINDSVNLGTVSILNPDGVYDYLLEYSWEGHAIRLYWGDTSWHRYDFRILFNGVVDSLSSSTDTLDINIADKYKIFDKDFNSSTLKDYDDNNDNRYYHTGSFGLAGTDRMKNEDTILPVVLGHYVFNISPLLVDPTNHWYKISELPCRVLPIEETVPDTEPYKTLPFAIRDRGVNLYAWSSYLEFDLLADGTTPIDLKHTTGLTNSPFNYISTSYLSTTTYIALILTTLEIIEFKYIEGVAGRIRLHGITRGTRPLTPNNSTPRKAAASSWSPVIFGDFVFSHAYGDLFLARPPVGTITLDAQEAIEDYFGTNSYFYYEAYKTPTATDYHDYRGIVKYLATKAGVTEFDDTKINSLGEKGFLSKYITSSEKYASIISSLSKSTGCNTIFNRKGQLTMIRLEEVDDNIEVDDYYKILEDDILYNSMELVETEAPYNKISLGYFKNYTIQDNSSLAAAVTEDPNYDDRYKLEFLEATSDLGVASNIWPNISSNETFTTDYTFSTTGASNFGIKSVGNTIDIRSSIRSKKRFKYSLDIINANLKFKLGDIVEIHYPRFGFNEGKKAIIVSMSENLTEGTATIEVWR